MHAHVKPAVSCWVLQPSLSVQDSGKSRASMAVLVLPFLGRQRCLKALEQGVHGRVAALFMGSGAVSRRQSI